MNYINQFKKTYTVLLHQLLPYVRWVTIFKIKKPKNTKLASPFNCYIQLTDCL